MPAATLRSNAHSAIAKPSALLQRKQKMTLSQTYYLAHVARGKLSKEAARSDHDLRLLVGHANLLDGLMLDLADAEREQERWFNQTVKGAGGPAAPPAAAPAAPQPAPSTADDRHVRWPESLPSVTEDYEEDSEDDSSDDEAEAEIAIARQASRPIPIPTKKPATVSTTAILDDDEDSDDDMAEDPERHAAELRLRRTPSHSASSPPELLMEEDSSEASDSDSDDMPPSPPAPELQRRDAFAGAKAPGAKASASADAFYEDGFYLPQRQSVAVY